MSKNGLEGKCMGQGYFCHKCIRSFAEVIGDRCPKCNPHPPPCWSCAKKTKIGNPDECNDCWIYNENDKKRRAEIKAKREKAGKLTKEQWLIQKLMGQWDGTDYTSEDDEY